ncbi:hypothetical protein CHUAL_007464 [Chamberlinius hualienensis]
MKFLLLALAVVLVPGLDARYPCSDPRPYYGTYIFSDRAYPCSDGTTEQCVSAVFELCGAPYTGSWVKGAQVNANCASIPTWTAIASFSGNGDTTYDGNNGHAAVFLNCESDGSVTVADQWCGKLFNVRTLPKSCSSSKPYSNCADYFNVIE